MSKRLIPLAAAAAMAAGASPAQAADWVYGGTTSGGESIAITAAKGAKSLRGAVIGWRATCDDGSNFSDSEVLSPAKPGTGLPIGSEDLVLSRNAKGRFKGTEAASMSNDTNVAMVSLTVSGKLSAKRASGTLSAVVKITDKATGAAAGACQTGTLRWSATRAPRTIYAGSTSQSEPVVVRVVAKPRRVRDVLVSWETQTCTAGGYYRFPDLFGNFRLSRSGAFGDPFTQDYAMDDGGKRVFAYKVSGRVSKTTARGTLQVTVTDTDATGAQTDACDTGGITWSARTG
jgi:hypothetical protein